MKAKDLVKSGVEFDEAAHRYTYEGKELTGVTPIVSWMYPETYAGVNDETMQKAAARGSAIHEECQMWGALGIEPETAEGKEYVKLVDGNGLEIIDVEYLVTDCESLASSVDVVFADGSLGDIKTTSQIHFENVALQLNIYRDWFEDMNLVDVPHLYVLWLPKEQYGKASIYELPLWDKALTREIVRAYKAGEDAAPYREKIRGLYAPQLVPDAVVKISQRMSDIDTLMKTLQEQKEKLTGDVLKAMQEYDVKSWDTGMVKFTRLLPTTRKTLDAKKVKELHPADVWAECLKESETKESIKITIRNYE